MKATKKIVGAACALVAAVALSAGSTFAWFVSSDTVKAEGMKIQATVPSSLYIANEYKTFDPDTAISTTWTKGTSTDGVFSMLGLDLADTAGSHKLKAATIAEKTGESGTMEVKYGVGESVSDGTQKGELTTLDTTFNKESTTFTGLTDYAAFYPMTLYKQSDKTAGEASGLKLNITVTASNPENFTASDTDKTLDYLHCGVLTSYESTVKWTSSITVANNLDVGTPILNLSEAVADMPENKEVHCLFVLWFDGADKDCTNIKTASVHDINVSLSFVLSANAG